MTCNWSLYKILSLFCLRRQFLEHRRYLSRNFKLTDDLKSYFVEYSFQLMHLKTYFLSIFDKDMHLNSFYLYVFWYLISPVFHATPTGKCNTLSQWFCIVVKLAYIVANVVWHWYSTSDYPLSYFILSFLHYSRKKNPKHDKFKCINQPEIVFTMEVKTVFFTVSPLSVIMALWNCMTYQIRIERICVALKS